MRPDADLLGVAKILGQLCWRSCADLPAGGHEEDSIAIPERDRIR
jgi:hypothetical protein